jgi:small subunit ribosomal protein S4e
VVHPVPGPHSKDACIPLGIILRDVLEHAHTMKEAKQILNSGMVKVNGIVRSEHGFPVGLMDVVEIDGEFHRVLPSGRGLRLYKTDADDAKIRLAKITDKHQLGKKRIQLSFHDGTNRLVEKDDHKTRDVVAIDVAQDAIKHSVKFDKGAQVIVTDGNNMGLFGKIHSIDRKLNTVVVAAGEKNLIVPIKYVFVVGHEKPLINIGE